MTTPKWVLVVTNYHRLDNTLYGPFDNTEEALAFAKRAKRGLEVNIRPVWPTLQEEDRR